MGYNDVIVCITVINLRNVFFFIGHRTGSISSDKSRSIRFLIMNTTDICLKRISTRTLSAGSPMDVEDVLRLILTSPAGKYGAGRAVEVRGVPRPELDLDVSQT